MTWIYFVGTIVFWAIAIHLLRKNFEWKLFLKVGAQQRIPLLRLLPHVVIETFCVLAGTICFVLLLLNVFPWAIILLAGIITMFPVVFLTLSLSNAIHNIRMQ